jgi:hypothetical protein
MADPIDPGRLSDVQREIAALLSGGAALLRESVDEAVNSVRRLAGNFAAGQTATEAFNNTIKDSLGQYALLAFRLSSVNSSVYGTFEAFTSVIPAIEATKSAFDKISKLSSGILNILPLGPLKAATTKSLTLFSAGLDFAIEATKFQLEAAQKVVNSYLEITKAGANFGGSITDFAALARETNTPMLMLSKTVKANIENLTALGGSIQGATFLLYPSMTKLFYSTEKLDTQVLAMYGSFEDLVEGVTDYYSLLAKTGVVIDQNLIDEKQKTGAVQEYLIRQKELSSLTGKSSKALAEAEAKRRTELDYSLRLSRLTNKEAADNARAGIEIITKIFGQEAGDVAKEFFATGGDVYSEAGRKFAAMAPDAFRSIQEVMGKIDTDRTTFESGVGAFFKANAPAFIANAKAGEELYSLNRAANNELLKTMGSVNASIVANSGTLTRLDEAFAKISQARQQGQADKPDATIGAESQAFVNSLREGMRRQSQLDTQVMKHMSDLDKITLTFYELQNQLINFQGEMFGNIREIIGGINIAAGDFENFAQRLGEHISQVLSRYSRSPAAGPEGSPPPGSQPPPTSPPNPAQPPEPPKPSVGTPAAVAGQPGFAEGGITTGPSLAGEAGPEAVIPLAKGDVPLKIDWTPLVNIMHDQVSISNEIRTLLADTKNIQEDILEATY